MIKTTINISDNNKNAFFENPFVPFWIKECSLSSLSFVLKVKEFNMKNMPTMVIKLLKLPP